MPEMTTIIDLAGSDRMGVCVVNAGRIAFAGTLSQAMDDGEPPISPNAIQQRAYIDARYFSRGGSRRAQ
jgi:hypothetical protein